MNLSVALLKTRFGPARMLGRETDERRDHAQPAADRDLRQAPGVAAVRRAAGTGASVLSPGDDRALDRLPATYAEVLRLHEGGEDAEAIAGKVGIEPEAVEPLVRVARAKLAALVEGAEERYSAG
jgi:DNA-directed RNA polymerase specialized sigma24 family protein